MLERTPFVLVVCSLLLLFVVIAGCEDGEKSSISIDQQENEPPSNAGRGLAELKSDTGERQVECERLLHAERLKFHSAQQLLAERSGVLLTEQSRIAELIKEVESAQTTSRGSDENAPHQMPSSAAELEQLRWSERILQSFLSTSTDVEEVSRTKKRVMQMLSQSTAPAPAPAGHWKGEGAEEGVFTPQFMQAKRDEISRMFHESFDSYMLHAYPFDELKPLSCKGKNVFGPAGYALTLIDALDTFVVLGNMSGFDFAVRKVIADVSFDTDVNVSVFETNIRALGGLLSAHFLALKHLAWYRDELLALAEDLGRRLLPAFDTKSGVPYGTVNLKHGVPKGETVITSAAGGGTVMLEFTLLSRALKTPEFEAAGRRATVALWERRSKLNLVGNHINIDTGSWTHQDAGLGTNIDSFYEYLIKGHLLFGDDAFLTMFLACYSGIMMHLKKGAWYLDVNMHNGAQGWMVFSSLASFWPGVQVLVGDIEAAIQTQFSIHSLWRRFGGIPEGFNLDTGRLHNGAEGYPLRPESIESLFYLHQATKDPVWISMGLDCLAALQTINKAKCGYAATANVQTRGLTDRMDSYFLAETVKYLYLLFDDTNWIRSEPYVFNTEGHPLPILHEFLNGSGVLYPSEESETEPDRADWTHRGGAGQKTPGGKESEDHNVGACSKLDYKRTIAAYGFDLLSDELAAQEEEEAAQREMAEQQQQEPTAAEAAEKQRKDAEARRTREAAEAEAEAESRRQRREVRTSDGDSGIKAEEAAQAERDRRKREAMEKQAKARAEVERRIQSEKAAQEARRQERRGRSPSKEGGDGRPGDEDAKQCEDGGVCQGVESTEGSVQPDSMRADWRRIEGDEDEDEASRLHCQVMADEGLFFPTTVSAEKLLAVEQSLAGLERFVYYSDGRCGPGHYVLGQPIEDVAEPMRTGRAGAERRKGKWGKPVPATSPTRSLEPAGSSGEDSSQFEATGVAAVVGRETNGSEQTEHAAQERITAESERAARELEQIMHDCQAERRGAEAGEEAADMPSEECQNRYMQYLLELGKQSGFESEVEYLLNRDSLDAGANYDDVALSGDASLEMAEDAGEGRAHVICRFVIMKETVASFDSPKQVAFVKVLAELSGLVATNFEVVRMYGGAGPRAPLKVEIRGAAEDTGLSAVEVANMLSQASESGDLAARLGMAGATFAARFDSPPSIVWGG